MPTPSLPLDGSCRCGQVHIRITKPPLMTAACHCRGCQKMSSSAFSLTVIVPADGLEVTKGEPVECGTHGPDQDHMACPHCMSWMFTRPAALDFMVNVRATLFDETGWYAPFVETQTAEKFLWAETGAPHGFDRFPGPEDMGPLIEAYAKAAAVA